MKRNPQLDLLRGLAVVMVIGHHYPWDSPLHRVGWAGVDLFFVLSGFLISGLLFTDWQRNQRINIPRFFIRRGFKIYPPFFAMLLLTAWLRMSTVLNPGHRLLSECFFMQDYLPRLWGHTWSLGVEEKFYILLPLLLLGLSKLRNGFRAIPYISGGLLILCLALRLHSEPSFFALHLRADALFVGVALGYWFHFHPERFHKLSGAWALPLAILFLVPLWFAGHLSLAVVDSSNSIGFALLLCWMMGRPAIRFSPLERVGFYSYSIYLWHLLITQTLGMWHPGLPMFLVNVVACCAFGILASRMIEVPVLALRERLTSVSVPRVASYGELMTIPRG